MTPPTRHDISSLARRQHWLVTSAQLTAAGHTREAVVHAQRSGRLFRVHPGVYSVGRDDLTREGRWMAAVLACGEGALLSHRAAARLWGLLDEGGERPEVLVAHASGRRGRPAFDVHRTTTLASDDVARRAGIPVTSVARTLLDLAAVVDRAALSKAVRQAERRYRVKLPVLLRRVAEPRRSVPHARLFALLTALVPAPMTESELEARFFELCVRNRIPAPQRQHRIGRHRADFCWPDRRLVVETDGRDHETWSAIRDDHVKDRALRAAGYDVLRFTWAEVVHQPGMVVREVRRALRRRSVGG